ncbi:hypothetical protein C8T65DRAFT_277032 [Cerioporus squamosus]|nr:hypothetical protein C8T65DRAFT_277032 [Cerioporus squamosus]
MPDSTNGTAAAAEAIAYYESTFLTNCFGFASFGLIVFEYCVTIGMEVDFLWNEKLTTASVLLFLNRYIMLVYQVCAIVSGNITYTKVRYYSISRCRCWFR